MNPSCLIRLGLLSLAAATVAAADEAAPPFRLKRTAVVDVPPWPRWNWAAFDQDKLVSVGEHQYVMYWAADRTLVLVRRNLTDNSVQALRLPKHKLRSDDSHRNTVLGVSAADGRLHLSWDHHADRLHYTRSRAGFLTDPPAKMTAEDIEPAQRMLKAGNESGVTYPRFFTDREGNLFFLYRIGGSGSGDTYLHRYDAKAGRWSRVGRLVSRRGRYDPWKSTSRNAYPHDVLFDARNRLHFTWVFREAGGTWASNHDLHYARSDDAGATWQDNAGKQIADLAKDDPIDLADPGLVVREIPVFSWVINTGCMALDSRSRPHVVTYKLPGTHRPAKLRHGPPPEIRRQLRFVHYWRDDAGVWQGGEPIAPRDAVVRRPDVVLDRDDNLYFYFPTGKGFQCLHARSGEKWKKWSVSMLTGPEITANDAAKHDRVLWQGKGILSFSAWRAGKAGKRFAILDFEPTRPPPR